MPPFPLPGWTSDLVLFSDWRHLILAVFGTILLVLLMIWWSQQTQHWFRIAIGTFLLALLLAIGSYYLFVVPAHGAGCDGLCPGWRGYPLPFARVELDGSDTIAPLDFMLNLLMLWLLWMGAATFWYLASIGVRWWARSWRGRLVFIVVLVLLPWALLPRILNPPQPMPGGEDLRLAVNARRSAEFTYRITGLWVQRLALEDIRHSQPNAAVAPLRQVTDNEVCLKGYTYFYLPWRRYRIALDQSGVTAQSLTEVPLDGSCWSQ
ncbi:MAG: hypothetical protein ACK2UO_14405 [Caldilineaceae bacterium]